jgi:MFS family permease
MFWLPVLADKIGRAPLVWVSLATQLVAYCVLYRTSNLFIAYGCLILLGTTFPGKHVVLYNYVLEILPSKYHQSLIALVSFFETFIVIVISFSYQYLSKRWQPLQFVGIVVTLLSLSFASFCFYESPKFLYINGRFEESRKSLMFIAWFNGLSKDEIERRFGFVFDLEAAARQLGAEEEGRLLESGRQASELVNAQMSD